MMLDGRHSIVGRPAVSRFNQEKSGRTAQIRTAGGAGPAASRLRQIQASCFQPASWQEAPQSAPGLVGDMTRIIECPHSNCRLTDFGRALASCRAKSDPTESFLAIYNSTP